jgi:hypothetical protein
MAEHDQHKHVEVIDDDRMVVAAEVRTCEGPGGTVRVSLRAESGHIAPGRRASLVDAVLDLPEVQESARLEAVFPLGDSESLQRLRERCEEVSTRPAGGSAILDANLPSGSAGRPAPEMRMASPSARFRDGRYTCFAACSRPVLVARSVAGRALAARLLP